MKAQPLKNFPSCGGKCLGFVNSTIILSIRSYIILLKKVSGILHKILTGIPFKICYLHSVCQVKKTRNTKTGSCDDCAADFFKDEIGDQACSECSEPGTVPVAGDDGRTSCCEMLCFLLYLINILSLFGFFFYFRGLNYNLLDFTYFYAMEAFQFA